jgi:hypothetical protein
MKQLSYCQEKKIKNILLIYYKEPAYIGFVSFVWPNLIVLVYRGKGWEQEWESGWTIGVQYWPQNEFLSRQYDTWNSIQPLNALGAVKKGIIVTVPFNLSSGHRGIPRYSLFQTYSDCISFNVSVFLTIYNLFQILRSLPLPFSEIKLFDILYICLSPHHANTEMVHWQASVLHY